MWSTRSYESRLKIWCDILLEMRGLVKRPDSWDDWLVIDGLILWARVNGQQAVTMDTNTGRNLRHSYSLWIKSRGERRMDVIHFSGHFALEGRTNASKWGSTAAGRWLHDPEKPEDCSNLAQLGGFRWLVGCTSHGVQNGKDATGSDWTLHIVFIRCTCD